MTDSLERNLSSFQGAHKASALFEIVSFYLRSDQQKAIGYVEMSKTFSNGKTDKNILAYAYLTEGIFLNRLGRLDSAMLSLEKAQLFARSVENSPALLRIYSALGHTSISAGNPEKGLAFLFEGLKVIEKHNDREMEMKFRTNIPWAYLELKQYRECIQYGRQNLEVMEGTNFEWIALYTYNNIAISYGALGVVDSARYYVDKAIHIASLSADNHSLANGYFILGKIYAEAGKYDMAIEQYLKAKPYREKVGNPFYLVSDLYSISDLYYQTAQYRKGIEAGKEALRIAEQYNLLLKFEGTYLSLARNFESLRDHKNASHYYRLYAMAKDTVYKHASTAAIAEMQTKYETEKKVQQLGLQRAELAEQQADLQRTYAIIIALTTTIVLIVTIFILLRSRMKRKQEVIAKEKELQIREVQIEASIQSQENERKRFAQDLHDGMGQLISALRLALHSVDKETTLAERVIIVSKGEGILNEMYREIRSIAFNLMPQTLVQQGLLPALKEMSERISDSAKIKVKVNSLDLPERFTEIQEISLYRVIQEWVNNIIKYANASYIIIQLIRHEQEINITIEDDGRGFDVNKLHLGNGNGWKNIQSRIKLIKGFMEVDSLPDVRGTTLIIRVLVNIEDSSRAITVQPNTQ